jgi:hypothetical protein
VSVPRGLSGLVGLMIYQSRLSPEGITSMLRVATHNPRQRMDKIQADCQILGHRSEMLEGAGIAVSKELMRISGKRLYPPSVELTGMNQQEHQLLHLKSTVRS